jgi:hypothetical protein
MAPRQYRIRNWAKFQHYKERNPPWIKLHAEILASADWVLLDDASKLLAVVCMVIAAKHDGCVPDSPQYIKRVAYLHKIPNLKPLIECGFLEIVQAGASGGRQEQATAGPEKEKESEKETEHNKCDARAARFEEFYLAYPRKEARGAAERAWRAALKLADAGTLIAAARAYGAKRSGEDKKFTKLAATWLTGKCWEDEGIAPSAILDPATAAEIQDRADRLMRRGKYAEKYA